MSKLTAAITAVGGYVPKFVMTNKMLEELVDTNDEWITSRTGIKERRILKEEEGEGTSFMCIKAAKELLKKGNIDPKEIDLVIVATVTPDTLVASTAAFVASEIGATNRPASPARAAPIANTPVNSVFISTPNAPTIVRLEAPARISMPSRV